jgi:hypothetical protein
MAGLLINTEPEEIFIQCSIAGKRLEQNDAYRGFNTAGQLYDWTQNAGEGKHYTMGGS